MRGQVQRLDFPILHFTGWRTGGDIHPAVRDDKILRPIEHARPPGEERCRDRYPPVIFTPNASGSLRIHWRFIGEDRIDERLSVGAGTILRSAIGILRIEAMESFADAQP